MNKPTLNPQEQLRAYICTYTLQYLSEQIIPIIKMIDLFYELEAWPRNWVIN